MKYFHRQLDGSLHMVVLIALLSLLAAVSPCRTFLQFMADLVLTFSAGFAGPLLQISQWLLYISQKILT